MRITRDTTDRLTVGIGQLLRVGRQLSHRAAHELYGDLPSYGWAVLVPLESGGEQRLSALALQLGVDGSVASRQVAVLERSGLITRRPDPQDGRASLLGLSEAGRAVLAHTRQVRSEWAVAALADWTDDEAELLGRLIERLSADLAAAGVDRALHPVPG
ncbi:MarR family transcriptional regulator [Geodermatophilus sp. Leaf369]|uniref:MarR family winged helix-turn-helix transcriptional regulator n=1 Tax=Geodermatophilus sp. Leaf369 TaxID=1736354 RepID=UPI0006F28E37|nr:MarR family transcriptional regulator [Geodermatophilus sp. Leaf369]KQS58754.1 MarR family transcriptional regulator [Geodermatophilus sp. Leaf369]QNG36400.1 MarR family transcriptional regulator [Geodermatophilaceae bacterium NBWT11]